MLRALAAQQATPQLLAAVRAGACGALASGVLRRGLAAMVEPTAFPPANRDSFHYAVLQAPLMKAGVIRVVVLSIMRPEHTAAKLALLAVGMSEGGDGRQPVPLPAAVHVLHKERLLHLLFPPPSWLQEETGGSLPRFLLPYVARLGGMGGLRAPDRGEQAYQVR